MRNRDRIAPALRIACAFMVFSGYLALASVQEYGLFLVLPPVVFLLLAPYGERLDARHPGYRVVTAAAVIGYLFFIPLTLWTMGLLNAVIALTVFIQAYVLMHQKNARNYYYLVLMAFFMVTAACVRSPEPMIAVALLMYLVATVWTCALTRIWGDGEVSRTTTRPRFMPLTEGAAGARARHERLDGGLIGAISVLSLAAFFISLGVFLITPRVQAGFLGRSGSEAIAVTGLSDSGVDLSRSGTIQDDPTAVMHVEFPEEPDGQFNQADAMYWRVATLSRYHLGEWTRKGLQEHYEPGMPPFVSTAERAIALQLPQNAKKGRWKDSRLVQQVIFMDGVPEDGMPCLDLAQEVTVLDPRLDLRVYWGTDRDFGVGLQTTGARRLTYSVVSEVGEPPVEAIRAAADTYSKRMSGGDYALLTYQELGPKALALTHGVVEKAKSPYDKVLAVENFLRDTTKFQYTRDVPDFGGGNPVDRFLLTERRGHCELFASAMALMLRSQGIPARVVRGFFGGEWDRSSNAYIVRAYMAHLWVEVLFPDLGWVRFDPSPPDVSRTGTGIAGLRSSMSTYLLRAKIFWYREVVGFDSSVQLSKLKEFSLGWFRNFRNFDPGETGFQQWVASALAAGLTVLLCIAALLGIALRAWFRYRRERGLTREQTQAVRFYEFVLGRLRRMGLDTVGKTAEELLAEAAGKDKASAALAEAIALYNRVRFGRQPFPRVHAASLTRALRRQKRKA